MVTWEEVEARFREYIVDVLSKCTRKEEYAEVLYENGLLTVYDCWCEYKHLPADEFSQALRKALLVPPVK